MSGNAMLVVVCAAILVGVVAALAIIERFKDASAVIGG